MLDRPDQFAHTVTEKLMTYALGRRVEYFDQPVIGASCARPQNRIIAGPPSCSA